MHTVNKKFTLQLLYKVCYVRPGLLFLVSAFGEVRCLPKLLSLVGLPLFGNS